MRRRLAVLVLAGWIAMVGAGARPALAHGGVVTVDDIYAGCHLVVQATPTPDAGKVQLTIVISAPDSGAPIANALVEIAAVPAGGGDRITLTVPPEAGQPGFYDATITLPALGDWQFTVRLREAGIEGTVPFTLTVQGPPPSFVWIIGLVPGVLGLALVGWLRLSRGPTQLTRTVAWPPSPVASGRVSAGSRLGRES
jgi:hypothetical protein